ncbi:MAG: hypothetical protein AAF299_04620 [Pseudomonadota bacterium]
MTDQNLGQQKRRDNRGVFYIGTGVMCAVAVTLAGCSGTSNKHGPFAGTSQRKLLEAEQAKLEKSERARKTAVRKLAVALAANKAKHKKLLAAQRAARKYRAELVAAHKDVSNPETRLAEAKASQVKTVEEQSALRQSEQLVESLKTKLARSSKERDALKAQLDEARKEAAKPEGRMLAATPQEEKAAKQRIEQLGARIESVESEKSALKLKCERVLQQAAKLDDELRQSRTKREMLNKKLLASLEKIESISTQHTQAEQAAAKEATALRDQLAKAKQRISEAQAEANSAPNDSTTDNQCSNH